MRRTHGLFITGTDTGVGKTYVASLIARRLAAEGRGVGVYKPAASGCSRQAGRLVSDDALSLWEAAGRPGDFERVCPQCFEAPLAPHLAARAEGRRLDAALLRDGLEYWRERSEIVLVEGSGGLMSPMGDDAYVADLAEEFGFPLIVVSRNALGTINQTIQTLIAASAFRGGAIGFSSLKPLSACDIQMPQDNTNTTCRVSATHQNTTACGGQCLPYEDSKPSGEGADVAKNGIVTAGIVLNHPAQPSVEDASLSQNRQELAARCVPPILAEVAWAAEDFDVPVDWFSLARASRACDFL